MERAEKAVELNKSGYNCCQAVLLAFNDVLCENDETLKKLGAGFGAGMGKLNATCGALCGAQMVLGLSKYDGKPIIKDAGDILKTFTEKCGATNCGDIKGIKTGTPLCSCEGCVRNAVNIIEEKL
ncbi:MAG: C_GCAxxG_C_C family protein [Clostridia bacterium]|nr:C_GCAxxG_C_C family protein [Clostridia bacterium]